MELEPVRREFEPGGDVRAAVLVMPEDPPRPGPGSPAPRRTGRPAGLGGELDGLGGGGVRRRDLAAPELELGDMARGKARTEGAPAVRAAPMTQSSTVRASAHSSISVSDWAVPPTASRREATPCARVAARCSSDVGHEPLREAAAVLQLGGRLDGGRGGSARAVGGAVAADSTAGSDSAGAHGPHAHHWPALPGSPTAAVSAVAYMPQAR